LAAARLRALSVQQLDARLDDRFRLLTGGDRAAPARQQTLRATLDWSHDLLGDRERTLLRRLAVFAGGWELAAAEAVCSGEGLPEADVLDLLAALVGHSLVVAEEAGRPGEETRYRLLETVRAYALERLGEGCEREATQRRHAAYYLELAAAAAPRLDKSDGPDWLARLAPGDDHPRAALGRAVGRGEARGGGGAAGGAWD